MKNQQTDIIILGGGLTGLTLSYLLKNRDVDHLIIEARNRLGGRILTDYKDNQAPIEKGATWLGKKHSSLMGLLKELNINTFEQELGNTAIYEPISTSPHQVVQLPPNNDPSFRIKGGTYSIIKVLSGHVEPHRIILNQVATKIEDHDDILTITTQDTILSAKMVISTLPPNLLLSSIEFYPSLPDSINTLTRNTHTWMGESIKVGLRFTEPFWRKKDLSGTIFSNVGPIPEMYDHSDSEDSSYALKGFLNGSYFSISREKRKSMVLDQLSKYFGEEVYQYNSYEEMVWRNERYTYSDYDAHILPHQNNGHPMFQEWFLNGKLIIGGSETASEYPGYMEGAVRSAISIYDRITNTSI
ncbi:MAG: NAD(P)-binding protein [Saprospiraceae bacterium]|nr:NAD(P)-binding protein [Saprospiraceae bacterium]